MRLNREARSRDISLTGDPALLRLVPGFRYRVLYQPVLRGRIVGEPQASLEGLVTPAGFELALVFALLLGAAIEALRSRLWWPPLLLAVAYHLAGMVGGFVPGTRRLGEALQAIGAPTADRVQEHSRAAFDALRGDKR